MAGIRRPKPRQRQRQREAVGGAPRGLCLLRLRSLCLFPAQAVAQPSSKSAARRLLFRVNRDFRMSEGIGEGINKILQCQVMALCRGLQRLKRLTQAPSALGRRLVDLFARCGIVVHVHPMAVCTPTSTVSTESPCQMRPETSGVFPLPCFMSPSSSVLPSCCLRQPSWRS